MTGALLIVAGAIGPLWLPFPITARGEIATAGGLNDVMHVVLGAMTILLELSIIGFGAVALGRWFRLYSILTSPRSWCSGLGHSCTRRRSPPANPRLGSASSNASPWGAWLLWLAVLAIVLLFGHQTLGRISPRAVHP